MQHVSKVTDAAYQNRNLPARSGWFEPNSQASMKTDMMNVWVKGLIVKSKYQNCLSCPDDEELLDNVKELIKATTSFFAFLDPMVDTWISAQKSNACICATTDSLNHYSHFGEVIEVEYLRPKDGNTLMDK